MEYQAAKEWNDRIDQLNDKCSVHTFKNRMKDMLMKYMRKYYSTICSLWYICTDLTSMVSHVITDIYCFYFFSLILY